MSIFSSCVKRFRQLATESSLEFQAPVDAEISPLSTSQLSITARVEGLPRTEMEGRATSSEALAQGEGINSCRFRNFIKGIAFFNMTLLFLITRPGGSFPSTLSLSPTFVVVTKQN
jgi:hypothetical protein